MMRLGMAVVALGIVPTMLVAQSDTSRTRSTDSTRGRAGRQQMSSGAIDRSSNRGQRLTSDQITQLQTALQQASCDPGTVDGIMGPRTRRAMQCARRQNNITGNNPNDLYRALNLNFASSDSLSGENARSSNVAAPGARGSRGARGSNRARGDTTGARNTRDSTRKPGTRPDTTRPSR